MIKFEYSKIAERLYPNETCPLIKVIGALPMTISDNIQKGNCWIAGGFMRRWYSNLKQDSDIDLFFKDSEVYNLVCEELKKSTIQPPQISEFNSMYTIKIDDTWTIQVQAINHRLYNNVDELIDSFDFTICQFVFDGYNIVATENAILDNQRKRLVPHKITYGVSSLRRIIKYTKQGYYMCGGAATEFLKQVKADPAIINSKVISVD